LTHLWYFLRNKSITPVSPYQFRNKVGAGKNPLCLLCRVVSQIPLQRLTDL